MGEVALLKYDAACQAIAAARAVDEAAELLSKAEAVRVYARQARNRALEIDAAEIRIRAERRLGEILAERKAAGTLHSGGRPPKTSDDGAEVLRFPTLKELGVDHRLSAEAQRLAALEADRFDTLVTDWRDGLANSSNRVTVSLIKRAARESLATELAEDAPLPDGLYHVIYADPPWRYETWGEGGMDRAADNHYRTMTVEEIAALPVADLAADDCILFMWVTAPFAMRAAEVMDAWGFEYKSQSVWPKERPITGHWFRNRHELLYLATKGRPPKPRPAPESVIEGPQGVHSEKPASAREMITEMTPGRRRIELFSRHDIDGWDRWGNQLLAGAG